MRSGSLVTGVLSALGLFAALPAEATTRRFAELQVSSTSPRDLLNARSRENQSFPSTFACGASPCILDPVDFPNTGTLAVSASDQKAVTPDITTTVSRVFYRQPMQLFSTTEACASVPVCPDVESDLITIDSLIDWDPSDWNVFVCGAMGAFSLNPPIISTGATPVGTVTTIGTTR